MRSNMPSPRCAISYYALQDGDPQRLNHSCLAGICFVHFKWGGARGGEGAGVSAFNFCTGAQCVCKSVIAWHPAIAGGQPIAALQGLLVQSFLCPRMGWLRKSFQPPGSGLRLLTRRFCLDLFQSCFLASAGAYFSERGRITNSSPFLRKRHGLPGFPRSGSMATCVEGTCFWA